MLTSYTASNNKGRAMIWKMRVQARALVSTVLVVCLLAGCGEAETASDSELADRPSETTTEGQTSVTVAESTTATESTEDNLSPTTNSAPTDQHADIVEEDYDSDPATSGSTEGLEERFGLAESEAEAYISSAGLDVNLYMQTLTESQDDLWSLNESFVEGNRDVVDATPAELERWLLEDVEDLIETPETFLENWNDRVPEGYRGCHEQILRMHALGFEASDSILNYLESYSNDAYTIATDTLMEAESLAQDAETCLSS